VSSLMARTRAPASRPAQRGSGLLVSPRSQASGVSDLPGEYRSLVDAVAAIAAETGGTVTGGQAAQRAGHDVNCQQSGNVRAKLKRLEDRGWLRRTATGKFTIAPGEHSRRQRRLRVHHPPVDLGDHRATRRPRSAPDRSLAKITRQGGEVVLLDGTLIPTRRRTGTRTGRTTTVIPRSG
jgi:hypothetical protein